MAFRLASVYFPNEKKNYVVPLKDVKDLHHPKSKTDFDPAKKYMVRWDVLKRQDSDTVEDLYEGFIQLIAATPESLIKQAAEKNIRLPRAFLDQHGKPKSCDLKPKNESMVKGNKKSSKHARKQVALALENSAKQRMSDIINAHKTDVKRRMEESTATEDLHCGVMKRPSSEEISGPERKRKVKKTGVVDDTSSESVSSDDTTKQQASKIEALQSKVESLERKVAELRTQNRVQSTDLVSANLRLQCWDKAFKLFAASVPKECAAPSPLNLRRQESSHSKVEQWLGNSPSGGGINSAVKRLHFNSVSRTPGLTDFLVTPIEKATTVVYKEKNPVGSIGGTPLKTAQHTFSAVASSPLVKQTPKKMLHFSSPRSPGNRTSIKEATVKEVPFFSPAKSPGSQCMVKESLPSPAKSPGPQCMVKESLPSPAKSNVSPGKKPKKNKERKTRVYLGT